MKKLLFALACLTSLSAIAQKKYPDIDIPYKKYVLDNGLTLIVHEDHKLPIAAFDIWYHVGSKNEKPGKTGFAHLFEHIMFTSTEHWGNFDEVMQTVGGGNNNGTTNNDRTNYFETFTNTGLDRVLWLEADRMGFLLNGLDSAKVNIQRGVVQNEKRQGDNEPYAIAEELTVKATFPQGHPYSWTVIGSLEDLSAASIDDVKEWFRTYYGPNNAVVSITGDVKADEVFEKVKKYFGDIPASPPIAKFTQNIAKMKGVVRQQAQDRVPQPRLQKTWNVPGWGTKEAAYLNLLSDVLTSGKSSRLYKRLVVAEDLCTNVFSYIDDREIGGQFSIFADAKPGVSLAKVDAIINEELKKILSSGVTEQELDRTKTNYFVQLLRGLENIGGFGGKSDLLAMSMTYGGSPDAYKQVQATIRNATVTDIRNVLNAWLTDGEYNLEILPYGDYSNTDSKLDRSQMPAVPAAQPASFPKVASFTLSNGLKVYLAERHELPLVNMIAVMNGGFSQLKADKAGLARLTSSMLLEGTTTKSSTQISDLLTNLGTSISSNAAVDQSTVSMSTLKTNFDQSLALYSDILRNPSFPAKEFDRVKKEQLLGIEQEKSAPNQLGRRLLPMFLYPEGHPYHTAFSGSGTKATVEKLSRADAVQFHQSNFAPNNAMIVVAGDVNATELKAALEKAFGSWKPVTAPAISVPAVELAKSVTVYLVDKPGASQSYIYAAQVLPSAIDPQFNTDKFGLMNNMLGGTFLSRLNMNLREDKHWSYGAFSGANLLKGPSYYSARTGVQTDKTKESIQEILKELTQINTGKPISKEEFENEQNSAILSLPGDWQTNSGVLSFLYSSIWYNRGVDYPGQYGNILKNLTLTDVQQAARIIQPANMTWLIVGDLQKVEAGIRELNLGPVKVLNADGQVIR